MLPVLGLSISLIVTKIVVATVLKKFVVSTVYKDASDITVDGVFVCQAKDGHIVSLKHRNKS